MLSTYKTDSIWADSGGLDASALIPFELGGTMHPNKPVVSVMDLGKMLLQCSREGETAKVRELMSRGAPFTTDWLGTTPLHVAASNNHYETCDVLLRAGVSKNARTKVDRTPLHFAVFEGHEQIVELLLANKCEIDAQDMLKMTPLHWSVERKHRKIVDLLLKHGADPCSKSKFNKTPMSLAIETNQPDVFQDLITYKMKMVDPEQQQATDSLVYELNRNRSDDDQPPLDIMQTDDTIICDSSESTSPAHLAVSPSPPPQSSAGSIDNGEQMDEPMLKPDNASGGNNSPESGKSVDTTLQILKDHGISMLDDTDSTLLNSALQSGRKLVLSDAGKMILNDPKFRKNIPVVRSQPQQQQSSPNPPPPPLTFNMTSNLSNTMNLEQLRKQKPPMVLQPAATASSQSAGVKGLPLKTNKVIKILSAEEFKQMCGANASGNTLKKISAESFHNGQLKYQTIANSNILTQLSRAKKPILNRIKLGPISGSSKPTILSEIKIKPIGQLQQIPKINANTQHTYELDVETTKTNARVAFNQPAQSTTPQNVRQFQSSSSSVPSNIQHRLNVSTTSSSSSNNSFIGSASKSATITPAARPTMGLSEIERQLLDLKKQTDELRKQLELSQKQNEEYKVRLEKLEQEKELEKEERYRQYTNSFS